MAPDIRLGIVAALVLACAWVLRLKLRASALADRYEPVIDVAAQPRVKLNTGAMMPVVHLGTSGEADNPTKVAIGVSVAIQSGYRAVDTAWIYFTEAHVAQGIKDSGVPREEVFITSKLFHAFLKANDVEPACRESVQNLATDYLDLYLIHWPLPIDKDEAIKAGFAKTLPHHQINIPIEETWRAMESLVEKGLVKAIGLSNFKISTIKHILSFAKIRPAVLQVEGHVYLQQRELRKFCDEEGIVIMGYMNLGAGIHPQVTKDPTVMEIAKTLGRSPADVCLRWPVQAGFAIPPKSYTPSRIRSNLKAALDPLPEWAMDKIANISHQHRYLDGAVTFPLSEIYAVDEEHRLDARVWTGKNLQYPTLRHYWEDVPDGDDANVAK
jgi:diketogulonate reductase-like aldo/keto reductase